MANLKRILLVLFGFALALAILWLGGKALGLRPLDVTERLGVLNREQLSYDGIDETCDPAPIGSPRDGAIDVFGGSSVAGVAASPGADFPRQLGQRLERSFPGRWVVRNRGRSAKNSYWALRCMEKTFGDGARTWVVYEGHNDFIDLSGPHLERSVFFEDHPAFLLALDAFLSSPASAVLRPFVRLAPPTFTFAEHERQVTRILELSEANYRAMIALAKAHGVHLVFCTVISNLDFRPYPVVMPDVPDGWNALNAYAHGQELYRKGDADGGYRFETLARDRDARIWRAPSRFNELMRRLAKENPDVVTLVDLERSLKKDFAPYPIGCSLFGQGNHCDWVHPNDIAHAWIAGQLEKVLR